MAPAARPLRMRLSAASSHCACAAPTARAARTRLPHSALTAHARRAASTHRPPRRARRCCACACAPDGRRQVAQRAERRALSAEFASSSLAPSLPPSPPQPAPLSPRCSPRRRPGDGGTQGRDVRAVWQHSAPFLPPSFPRLQGGWPPLGHLMGGEPGAPGREVEPAGGESRTGEGGGANIKGPPTPHRAPQPAPWRSPSPSSSSTQRLPDRCRAARPRCKPKSSNTGNGVRGGHGGAVWGERGGLSGTASLRPPRRIWDMNQQSLYLRDDQLVAGHLQGANAALEGERSL